MVYRHDHRTRRNRGRYVILGIIVGIVITIGGVYVYDKYSQPITQNFKQVSNSITNEVEKDNPISNTRQKIQEPSNIVTTQENNQVISDINPLSLEHQIHEKINSERQQVGLKPLIYDEKLASIARDHSKDMAVNDYFDHISPNGKTLDSRLYDAKYPCYPSGENIQETYTGDNSDSIVQSWMDSSGHEENILRSIFISEGIGVYQDGQNLLITEDFC